MILKMNLFVSPTPPKCNNYGMIWRGGMEGSVDVDRDKMQSRVIRTGKWQLVGGVMVVIGVVDEVHSSQWHSFSISCVIFLDWNRQLPAPMTTWYTLSSQFLPLESHSDKDDERHDSKTNQSTGNGNVNLKQLKVVKCRLWGCDKICIFSSLFLKAKIKLQLNACFHTLH